MLFRTFDRHPAPGSHVARALQLVLGVTSESDLTLAPDESDPSLLVPVYVPREFHECFKAPFDHAFAHSVPTDEALEAVADAASKLCGVVELGAGTGYWAALLRARGVDVLAYDVEPPTLECKNRYFSHAFTDVLQGSVEKLGGLQDRALMLVWPYNEDEHDDGSRPWDLDALNRFEGDVVIHCGDLEERSINTSAGFSSALAKRFVEERRVTFKSWPGNRGCEDTLTVWRRRR